MKKVVVIVILALAALAGWSIWDSLQDTPWQGSVQQGSASGGSFGSAWQGLDLAEIPEYRGEPAVEVNGGEPQFSESEIADAKAGGAGGSDDDGAGAFVQEFSRLDSKGRCGPAFACLDEEHMPEGERGSIGMIRPSGWQTVKYDFIDNGGYLYNRCHLIGWQLTGVNDDERNLITGTRYMNVEGMLPYEDEVAACLRSSGGHVLYRITPVFDGKELLARGVQMEALSLEDQGASVRFNVFCYNVQPGVEIDYSDGKSRLAEGAVRSLPEDGDGEEAAQSAGSEARDYVLNTNTRRFHDPGCKSVSDMKDKNKEEFHGSREELIEQGYKPCGNCRP